MQNLWRYLSKKSNLITGMLAVNTAGVTLNAISNFLSASDKVPIPSAYIKSDVHGGPLDRAPPMNPGARIKLLNSGCSPMKILDFKIEKNGLDSPDFFENPNDFSEGVQVSSFAEAIGKSDKFELVGVQHSHNLF